MESLWVALAGLLGAIITKSLDVLVAYLKGANKANSTFKVELLHAEDRFRETLMQELEAMRERVSALEAALEEYRRENDALIQRAARLEEENRALRIEVERLKHENTRLKQELERLGRKIDAAQEHSVDPGRDKGAP